MSRLYALDVGVYARAPLITELHQLLREGDCVAPRVVLQVFRHKLHKSISYFTRNYVAIKQSILPFLPRLSRRQSIHRILHFLETIRQGVEDSFVYTVLRSALMPPLKCYAGSLLSNLLNVLEHTRHLVEALDALYLWLRSTSSFGPTLHPLVTSVEDILSRYLEEVFNCDIGVCRDYEELIHKATRLAKAHKINEKEDVAILLSLCDLVKMYKPSTLTLLTVDRKIGEIAEKLAGSLECLNVITTRLIQAR